MAMKKMYLANYNITFGNKEEPLLKWLDNFVFPALNSGIKRTLKSGAKVMFQDVQIKEIDNDELILTGLIIKDTIVDILNEYDDNLGLVEKDDHYKSSPYSVFVVFLKNHRMALVKRQPESPDLRLFISTTQDILKEYRKLENKNRKENGGELLPYAIIGIKGIKSMANVTEALKAVKKIKRLTLKMKPSNNELLKLDSVLSGLDEDVRKKAESKTMRIVVSSPQSKNGVAAIIEETNGLAEAELEVEYLNDNFAYDTDGTRRKSTGKIKDNEMSQAMDINLPDDLIAAEDLLYGYCSQIDSLQVETPNIIDYREYLKNRKR